MYIKDVDGKVIDLWKLINEGFWLPPERKTMKFTFAFQARIKTSNRILRTVSERVRVLAPTQMEAESKFWEKYVPFYKRKVEEENGVTFLGATVISIHEDKTLEF